MSMELFLDLYGFLSVVLHACALLARSMLLGAVVFLALLAPGLGEEVTALGRRVLVKAGIAALASAAAATTLGVVALSGTLEIGFRGVIGADFVRSGIAALLAMLLILLLGRGTGPLSPLRRGALLAAGVALLLAVTAGSHAMARTEERPLLLATTLLHQLGAALWIGGLPCLLGALKLEAGTARAVGRRYSAYAAAGVGLILLGTLGFWRGYVQEPAAVYGTAYGAMAGTKAVLLCVLLALGAANFLLLHRMEALPGGLLRVRRFVESELAIGVAMMAVAASLTSVPPAADLPDDRVTWAEIVHRFTPAVPRLTSPSHGDLAIPALQAQLDQEWQQRQNADRPQAFIPGEGLVPPRNAQDLAWSEYNHNWAGVMVLLVGLAALLDATSRVPWARHWPLVFLGLAAFLLVRSDPEAWPLGDIGFWESLRDPEVLQHKLASLLVVVFAVSEWGVRLGWWRGPLRYVFPIAMIGGAVLLLGHTHAIANIKELLLVELSHLPLAVLALVGGCARWIELRGPEAMARRAAWVWPICLIVIGSFLLIYRES